MISFHRCVQPKKSNVIGFKRKQITIDQESEVGKADATLTRSTHRTMRSELSQKRPFRDDNSNFNVRHREWICTSDSVSKRHATAAATAPQLLQQLIG